MDNNELLLGEISGYCRRVGMAELTFGRLAVNDGKLVSRLRVGGRVTTETVQRVHSFIEQHRQGPLGRRGRSPLTNGAAIPPVLPRPAEAQAGGARNFRFYDNRQKYLLFVTTCGEKQMVAQRVAMELASLHPRPPALRVFDAGIGDGTVLSRVMRAMHYRFPTMPFYIVGKEISLEDVRLALEKMPDRLLRASRDDADHHQHVLLRGALARAQFGDRGDQPGVAGGRAHRHHGA